MGIEPNHDAGCILNLILTSLNLYCDPWKLFEGLTDLLSPLLDRYFFEN